MGELLGKVGDEGFLPARDLIVVHDELDLPLGRIQVRERGGSAGHNGIKSILGALEDDEWMRVRVGIAHRIRNRKTECAMCSRRFAKQICRFSMSPIEKSAGAVKAILRDGAQAAMNTFNRKPEAANGPTG